MTNEPLVSVIMNCLDCERYLKEAIDSVYAQTYDNWEIIFWDNVSTDSSQEIAKSYDHKIRYFKSQTTIPLGKARNKAIEQANGELIAFLDCDDIWLPEKLVEQVPLFQDNKIGLVYSDVLVFDETGRNYKWSEKFNFHNGFCFAKLLSDYFLNMQSVVLKKEALDNEEHWFDDELEYMEERDLFTRIGYNFALAKNDRILAKYRVHSKSITSTNADEIGYKELEYILHKYKKIYHDFEVTYPTEIQVIQKTISYNKAYWLWQNKKNAEARKILNNFVFKDLTCTVIFFLSYLPFINLKEIRRKMQ